jgi:glucose/arabinose dehydrogenase
MRRGPIAALAVCAGLACGACATDGRPAPDDSAPAPSGAVPAAPRVGTPSVLVSGLAVPWAIAFLPGGDDRILVISLRLPNPDSSA